MPTTPQSYQEPQELSPEAMERLKKLKATMQVLSPMSPLTEGSVSTGDRLSSLKSIAGAIPDAPETAPESETNSTPIFGNPLPFTDFVSTTESPFTEEPSEPRRSLSTVDQRELASGVSAALNIATARQPKKKLPPPPQGLDSVGVIRQRTAEAAGQTLAPEEESRLESGPGPGPEAVEAVEAMPSDPPPRPDEMPDVLLSGSPFAVDAVVPKVPETTYVNTINEAKTEIPTRLPSEIMESGTVDRNEQGQLRYSTGELGRDGNPTKHLIADMLEILPPGMTIDRYQNHVLNKPIADFPNSVKRIEKRLEALAPDAQGPIKAFLAALEANGMEYEIRETLRPQERQEWIYQQGRTRPGGIATWTLTSLHRTGRAVDVFIDKQPNGNARTYKPAWDLAERMGIITLRERDPGHFAAPLPNAKPIRRATEMQINYPLTGNPAIDNPLSPLQFGPGGS